MNTYNTHNMVGDKKSSPIFVTGIERSGSSLIARILHMAGAFTGKTNVMYENIAMRKIIDSYYRDVVGDGSDVFLGQYPLPDTDKLMIPVSWSDQMHNVLSSEGYHAGLHKYPWMAKSAKITHLWPIWHYAFPNAKWIIVRRRTGDIVQSCIKTAHMNAFKNKNNQIAIGAESEWDAWLLWVREHEKRFVDMMQTGVNCKVIWPERMVDGDYQQIHEMLDWVGLPWKSKITTTIDPLLWKSRVQKKGGDI